MATVNVTHQAHWELPEQLPTMGLLGRESVSLSRVRALRPTLPARQVERKLIRLEAIPDQANSGWRSFRASVSTANPSTAPSERTFRV